MSQARKIWDEITKRKTPFTANEVASKMGLDAQTVRHYFTYWRGKEALKVEGKVEAEAGTLGRPRNLWRVVSKEFVSVWR